MEVLKISHYKFNLATLFKYHDKVDPVQLLKFNNSYCFLLPLLILEWGRNNKDVTSGEVRKYIVK